MNAKIKRIPIPVPISIFVILVATALRTVAALLDLDYKLGFFNNGTFILASNIIVVSGIILILASTSITPQINLKGSFISPTTYVVSGVCGVGIAYSAIRMLSVTFSGASDIPLSILFQVYPARKIAIFTALFGIISIGHFFLNIFLPERKDVFRAYFAVSTVLFCATYATYLYFDTSTPINAPNKIIDQMAYLFSSLFFLYETRISMGKDKWRGYIVSGAIASILCAYSSIPSLIVYFANGFIISASIEESVCTLAIFIFIITRLFQTMYLHGTEEDKLIGAIREFAEKKQHGIDEKNMSRQMIAHHQISIDELINESVESHSEQDEFACGSESDFAIENSEDKDEQIYADPQEEGMNNEENTGN